ncbi:MAG TPA: polyphosphate kinase 2 family protein, partial [Verrucomicrobiae bacterium]|nr:polyphosphate kinase 2 family protein [Verrucomicrobiae bacterium]
MKLRAKQFRVKEGEKLRLAKWPTEVSPFYKSKDDYEKCLRQHVEDLSSRQNLLYAHNRYALLII